LWRRKRRKRRRKRGGGSSSSSSNREVGVDCVLAGKLRGRRGSFI
jgi:hypothetical protein